MGMLIQLILSVSIPLSAGVIIVFFLYYRSVYNSLYDWQQNYLNFSPPGKIKLLIEFKRENISTQWYKNNDMQILHNLVLVNKIISEIHLQKISNDLITYQGLYNKFINKQVKIFDENKSYRNCSYRYFAFNMCEEEIYDAFKINHDSSLFINLYSHRTNFTFNSFSRKNQERLKMDWDFQFFAKSVFNSRKNDLVAVSLVYNTYNDSLLTSVPSQNVNLSSVPYQDCYGFDFVEPYDPRCRGWYINAMENPGNQFYKPYLDLFTTTTIMTASARIDDAQGNNFSVISVDFVIKSLIEKVFKRQDQEVLEKDIATHSVLFHVENNTVYHHKNWDSSERTLKQWEDLEFNSTFGPYKDNEKEDFILQVEDTKLFSLNGKYDIKKQINLSQFYQIWKRDDKPQVSLFYPLEVKDYQSIWNKTQTRKQVLMVGKVREDTSEIFKVLNLSNSTFYALLLALQTFIFVLFVLIITLNFGAVLMHQVDIPLAQLTQYLQQNNYHSNKQQEANDEKQKKHQQLENSRRHNEINYQKINLSQNKKLSQDNSQLMIHSFDAMNNELSANSSAVDFLNNRKKSTFQKNHQLQQNRKSQRKSKRSYMEDLKDQLNEKKFLQDKYLPATQNNFKNDIPDLLITQAQNYSGNFQSTNKEISVTNPNQHDLSFGKSKEERVNTNEQIEKSKGENFTNPTTILSIQYKKNTSSSMLSSQQQIFENKINIAEDIEPMFFEMQVIKDTFHQLGNVIAYKKNDMIQQMNANQLENNNSDFSTYILHYSFAAKLFKQLKNNFGISISHINLGYFCQISSDYIEALFHYQTAFYHSIIQLGYNTKEEFLLHFNEGNINLQQANKVVNEQLIIICLSLVLQIHAIKEIILDRQELYDLRKIRKYFFNKGQKKEWLNRAIELYNLLKRILKKHIQIEKKIIQNNSLLLVELEIFEIFIELDQIKEAETRLFQFEKEFFLTKNNYQLELLINNVEYSPNANQNSYFQSEANPSQVTFSIMESNVEFLKGSIALSRKQFSLACEHFENCLQSSFFLDINLQRKCLFGIKSIFNQNSLCIRSVQLAISYLNYKTIKKVYDIAIIIEGQIGVTINSQSLINQHLMQIYQQFIRKQDRTTFIVFQDKETRIIQPLLTIDKFKQWKFCVESIPNISHQLIYKTTIFNYQGLEESNMFMINNSNNNNNPTTTNNINDNNNFNNKKNNNNNNNIKPEDVYIPNNRQSILNKQKFVQLQQQLVKKIKFSDQNLRKTIFFVFSNSSIKDKEEKLKLGILLKKLQQQFSSTPQIIHFKKQQEEDAVNIQKIMKAIQNEEQYIELTNYNQLNYFIKYYKRSDNSRHYLTNLILTQSNL